MSIYDKLNRLKDTNTDIEVVSTGILSLDIALSIGGLPTGRIVELYGQESSGRTSVALHIVKTIQSLGGTALWLDINNSFNLDYVKNNGINIDELLFSQPKNEEIALEITEAFINSNLINIIVIDTISALLPEKESEDDMIKTNQYLQSKLIADTIKRISTNIKLSNTILLMINQKNSKKVNMCGKAVPFYSAIRLEIIKLASLVSGNDRVGSRNKIIITKNKLAGAGTCAEFNIFYDIGISSEDILMELAIDLGIIKRHGSYFFYNYNVIGRGKKSVIKWLKTDKISANSVSKQILNNSKGGVLYSGH